MFMDVFDYKEQSLEELAKKYRNYIKLSKESIECIDRHLPFWKEKIETLKQWEIDERFIKFEDEVEELMKEALYEFNRLTSERKRYHNDNKWSNTIVIDLELNKHVKYT